MSYEEDDTISTNECISLCMYICMHVYTTHTRTPPPTPTHTVLEALNGSTEGSLWRKGSNVHLVDRM
jgi:hypothetical protein